MPRYYILRLRAAPGHKSIAVSKSVGRTPVGAAERSGLHVTLNSSRDSARLIGIPAEAAHAERIDGETPEPDYALQVGIKPGSAKTRAILRHALVESCIDTDRFFGAQGRIAKTNETDLCESSGAKSFKQGGRAKTIAHVRA